MLSSRTVGAVVVLGILVVSVLANEDALAASGELAAFSASKAQSRYAEGLKAAGIEPFSRNPSETKPRAVCPPPSRTRFGCLAAVLPEKLAARDKSTIGGPLLEGSGQRGGYSPVDLRSAYNLPAAGGSGLTIAITIAYDYPTAEADLATYRATYGLPPCTGASGCFQKVNQEGEAKNYPEPEEGWAAEAALDLDMTSAICPECKLLLVEANDNTDENLFSAVSEAATLGANVISDSWGGPEFSEETTLDPSLNHPGAPVLFASGDASYRAEYPASSSDVIAVGGTSLRKDESKRGWGEMAWAGAGSGCSEYEEKPAWQNDAGCTKRSVADVSAVADPDTPVSVYDTYGVEYQGWLLFGGTSVATPIMAGVEAHSSAAQRAEGARLFWEEGAEGKLFDIGEGRNGNCLPDAEYLCHARLGYDGPTGWGTPGASRPGPPAAATYDPTAVRTTEATLNGAVNPNGEETSYRFEYGRTTSYGTSVPVSDGNAGSGTEPLDMNAQLSGLERNVAYHYRLVAENASGVTYGGDRSFETFLWSAQHMQRTVQTGEMLGVSCASPSFCMSVGDEHVHYEHNLWFNEEPLAERWDGSEWAKEVPPVLHPAGEGYYSLLAGVSCSSPDFCMAIGENYELEPGFQPLAERWDGSEWSIVPMPMPNEAAPNPSNGQREVRIHGISCSSATACVAVGQFTRDWESSPEEVDTLVEIWDGTSWTIEPSPGPAEGKVNILWSVSCLSAASCVAVGESRDAGNAKSTLIERWDGSSWSIESAPTLAGGLRGVSCSSESACMAVGSTEGNGGDGVAETWDGSEWAEAPLGWPMRSVSCLAGDWCVAVGGDGSAHAAFGAIWDGERWLLEQPVSPVDASDNPKEMFGVSCEQSGCTAVGWYYSWGYRPLAERLDRSLVAPPPTVANDPARSVTKVSATLNAHVDNNGGVGSSDNAGKGGSDCHFEVALSFAPDTPIAEPSCALNPVEGDASQAVEAQVTGLESGTEYVYRVVASNEGGTSKATPDGEFTTLPSAPSIANDPANAIAQTTAVLNGHVDNEGAMAGTSCKFVVALESAPGTPVAEPACDPDPITGKASVAVRAEASGLQANTAYVYRVEAESGGGASIGAPDQQFTTLPNAPTAANDAASATTQTSALLHGHVDNEGAEAGSSCWFVLALKGSPDTPVAEAPCAPSLVGGNNSTDVQAKARELSPNTAYVYRVIAESEGGIGEGTPDGEFRTPPDLPVAAFAASTSHAIATKPLRFEAASPNPDEGTIAFYGWDFGDGGQGAGATPSHTYAEPGTYTVTLRATDDAGLSGASQRTITVELAPNRFSVRRMSVRCDGRIVLRLAAPGAGSFAATANAGPDAISHRSAEVIGHHRSECGGTVPAPRARGREGLRRTGSPYRGPFPYGRSSTRAQAVGSVVLSIKPRRAALRALRRFGRLRIRIALTFDPDGGLVRTKHVTVIVR